MVSFLLAQRRRKGQFARGPAVEAIMHKINLAEKFRLFDDYWSPKIVGEINDSFVKLAKFKGEFMWHSHANEDELFLVVEGRLRIKFRDSEVRLEAGEFAIVPRGVEHLPIADDEAHVLLLEPKSTLNTGNVRNDRTVDDLERI
jgi:mannose-6-phosphate isomerase-like protein (cupin superfamily)